jgi:hypothetical protein
LVAGHFEAQLDLAEQSDLPLTAPGAAFVAEQSAFAEQSDLPLTAPGAALAEQSALVPQLFSPTAPGAALAEQSLFVPQLFSPTAPGAAAVEHFEAQSPFAVAQQPDLVVPTAPGAAVFCELAHAPRKAIAERAARVAIFFIEESPSSVCRVSGPLSGQTGFVLPQHAGLASTAFRPSEGGHGRVASTESSHKFTKPECT